MTEFEEHLRRYAAGRAGRISENDAELLVARALGRPARSRWARHGFNAAAAVVLSLLLVAGGVAIGLQRGVLHSNTPVGGVRLPAVPNDLVYLDDPSQGLDVTTPFRLHDGKLLAPRARWLVAPDAAIMVTSGGLCDLTTIHVVDLGSPPHDSRPPVSLPDCYDTPVVIPHSTTILLAHHRFKNGDQRQPELLGEVVYDWDAGRVVKTYSLPSLVFITGLVSPDGSRLYALDPFADAPALDIFDLGSGQLVAHVPVALLQVGLNQGGLALSPDGRTLFVNLGDKLGVFDAQTGASEAVLDFKEKTSTSSLQLPGWLAAIDADAKEGFEPGHGIAVDPKGHWVAALGGSDRSVEGIWIFSTSGGLHLARRVAASIYTGIAFSSNGAVLYALGGPNLHVRDPQSGTLIKGYALASRNPFDGIGSVDANAP
jgi:hypothetical protein